MTYSILRFCQFLYIDGSSVCNMHDASAAENDAARVVQKLLKRRKSIVKLLVLGKKADPNQWLKR